MSSPIFCFYHIPKTGGRTLIRHMREELGSAYMHLGPETLQGQDAKEMIAKINTNGLTHIKALSGHEFRRSLLSLPTDRVVQEAVFIREPAQRLVSLYNFVMRRHRARREPVLSFRDWYSSIRPDSQLRFMTKQLNVRDRRGIDIDNVCLELQSFWLVGQTEELDSAWPFINLALNIPQKVPKRGNVASNAPEDLSLDADELAALNDDNPLDHILWHVAGELWRRHPAQLGKPGFPKQASQNSQGQVQ